MKVRFFSILASCLLLALPVVSGTSYSQTQNAITESAVLAMINSVDRAARKGNVAGIIAPLAKDVTIKMTVTSPASPMEQVFNLSKEQYAFHTRRGLRLRLAYQLERKNTRIKIYDDGKSAIVIGDLHESLTVEQGTFRAVSVEVAILSLRNGRIVVTSIESNTRVY